MHVEINGQIYEVPDNATPEQIQEGLGLSEPSSQTSQPQPLWERVPADLRIGLAKMAQPFLNIPSGIAQQALQKVSVSPEEAALGETAHLNNWATRALAQMRVPEVSAEALGLKGDNTLFDTAIQKATEYGLPSAGVYKAASGVVRAGGRTLAHHLPLLNRVAAAPYKRQLNILAEKNLLGGYTPPASDLFRAAELLKSKGMKIPHEGVDLSLARALEGHFKPAFRTQSSLRSQGRKLSSQGGTNAELGEEFHNLAKKIHDYYAEQQIARGAPEAAREMLEGEHRYRQYHKLMAPRDKLVKHLSKLIKRIDYL